MYREADHVTGHVGSVIGTLVGVAMNASALRRQQDAADCQVRAARCARAAAGARAGVLADTVDSLRERLADARDDAEGLRDLVQELQAQVAKLTADRRILADALQGRRAG